MAFANRKPRPAANRTPAGGGRTPVIRLMPVLIVAALCMLGFRIQVVVKSIAIAPSEAFAQAQPAEPVEQTEAMADETAAADATDEGESEDGGDNSNPMALKPSNLTASEIETLQRLAERREMIERREREMQQKENLVQAAETRLDTKISQLQEIEKNLQGLVQQYDAKKKAEIEQLVRIYTAMKPKDAARIFDDLEMGILVAVVTNMKETKVAPIISAMQAEKARALTEEMSSRKAIPGMASMAPAAAP